MSSSIESVIAFCNLTANEAAEVRQHHAICPDIAEAFLRMKLDDMEEERFGAQSVFYEGSDSDDSDTDDPDDTDSYASSSCSTADFSSDEFDEDDDEDDDEDEDDEEDEEDNSNAVSSLPATILYVLKPILNIMLA